MEKVKQNIGFVKALCSLNPKEFKTMLRIISNDKINVLSDIILNVLCGDSIPTTERERKAMRKYANFLRKVASSKIGNRNRRKIFVTKAKLFHAVLSLICPRLDDIIKLKNDQTEVESVESQDEMTNENVDSDQEKDS